MSYFVYFQGLIESPANTKGAETDVWNDRPYEWKAFEETKIMKTEKWDDEQNSSLMLIPFRHESNKQTFKINLCLEGYLIICR